MADFFKKDKDSLTNIPNSFWDLKLKDIDFNEVNFKDYESKAKAFLLVNVACDCGLTKSNYKELVELDNKWKEKGLEIWGFPSNQFFAQEKRPEKEIKEFVSVFDVKFKLFSKIEVNGENTHDVYKFLRHNSNLYDKETDKTQQIPWNFTKFLVNSQGKVIKMFEPTVKPLDLENDINKVLEE